MQEFILILYRVELVADLYSSQSELKSFTVGLLHPRLRVVEGIRVHADSLLRSLRLELLERLVVDFEVAVVPRPVHHLLKLQAGAVRVAVRP